MIVTPELINKYFIWYLAQGHTYVSTQEYVNNIKRYVGEGVDINQRTVDKFREKAMRTTTSGALKSFFSYLVHKHDYPQEILNIRFDRNKQTNKEPKSITVQEVEIIINHMPTLKDKIFTIFIYELGLRISEGLKIKWDDFNWIEWLQNKEDYGKVMIRKTKRNKFRSMPVKSVLMKLLYDVCKTKNELNVPVGTVVFNYGIESYVLNKSNTNEKNLYMYIHAASCRYREKLYKISKTYLNKRISPHWLRHSKAQFLLDNDMPLESLKKFLGHEKISSTEIYAQASSKKLERDLKAYDIYKKSETIDINK